MLQDAAWCYWYCILFTLDRARILIEYHWTGFPDDGSYSSSKYHPVNTIIVFPFFHWEIHRNMLLVDVSTSCSNWSSPHQVTVQLQRGSVGESSRLHVRLFQLMDLQCVQRSWFGRCIWYTRLYMYNILLYIIYNMVYVYITYNYILCHM